MITLLVGKTALAKLNNSIRHQNCIYIYSRSCYQNKKRKEGNEAHIFLNIRPCVSTLKVMLVYLYYGINY